MSKRNAVGFVTLAYVIALLVGLSSFHYFNTWFSHVLLATLLADLCTTVIIFGFSVIVNNSSMYDPYWSVIPPLIYLLWVFRSPQAVSIETLAIGVGILIWAGRLTGNWVLNWKGVKHEDWRYVNFRKKFGGFYWLISLLAIHLFPTLMVFLACIPLYYALFSGNDPNLIMFIIGLFIVFISVVISLSSDYSLFKHRKSNASKKSIQRGLWKYSRHPNYLGEITFWFGILILGYSYTVQPILMGAGALGMLLLFECYSIPAMEKRMRERRADYFLIQQKVPKLFPFGGKRILSRIFRVVRMKRQYVKKIEG